MQQLPSSDYGLFVWPSAILLAEFFSYHRAFFRGKKIVELGSGVGLAGIVAAKVGAAGSSTKISLPEHSLGAIACYSAELFHYLGTLGANLIRGISHTACRNFSFRPLSLTRLGLHLSSIYTSLPFRARSHTDRQGGRGGNTSQHHNKL